MMSSAVYKLGERTPTPSLSTKPSFPRKRESTAARALLLQSEALYQITYDTGKGTLE
jgi:hypothetical protein